MKAEQIEAQAVTRDGRAWHPSYLLDIDQKICIGCGRCFKVCGRSVMTLQGILRKVMTVTDPGACVGCGACGRVCGKNCQRHGPS